jgi:hypothetical protein
VDDGYYYYDENDNGICDAGEPVWRDIPGGNRGRYNSSKRTFNGGAPEPMLMGGPPPSDEQKGSKFEDIPKRLEELGLICSDAGAKTMWADLNGNYQLDQEDFIWVDLPD